MADDKKYDRIFVSIAVSKPGGDLDKLPGAITAARRMAQWADAHGYLVLHLDDEMYPEITVDLLRDSISETIKKVTQSRELKRLVIYFAGHGAALAFGDQYWILTKWHVRKSEAIKVSSFQRMLEYYGPTQVALIGDACQEFSAKFFDVVGSPILDQPDELDRGFELDQFFAVDVTKQAFMIKGKDGQEDFCIFTEVLLDALEGDMSQDCFDIAVDGNWTVTSQSIAKHLAGAISKEASRYGVRMFPRPRPGFYTDKVYVTYPPPEPSQPHVDPIYDESHWATSPPGMAPVEPGLDIPERYGLDGVDQEFHVDHLPPLHEPPTVEMHLGFGGGNIQRVVGKVPLKELDDKHRQQFQAHADALQTTRESKRQAFTKALSEAAVRNHFETRCGICVIGAEVANVVASFGQPSRVDENPNWFRIALASEGNPLGWSDSLVTLQDGRILSVCAVFDFVTHLQVLDARSITLFHRVIGAPDDEVFDAINLLGRAHAGLLQDNEIINGAMMLREGKHRIITLGCIAAQFYDLIRDVDSLRSMAAFYVEHNQPVPLDIILYGGGTIHESDGKLYADIPAVGKREPRTSDESRTPFSYAATPAYIRHPIAGRIPWMRDAWGAIATASCDDSARAWRSQALEVMNFLALGTFTVVKPKGRDAFLKLAGIASLDAGAALHTMHAD